MTEYELECVRDNASRASTEDLIDRVTAYREGMEPDAVQVIEKELARRGIDVAALLAEQAQHPGEVLRDENGLALMCSFCRRPAVVADADKGGLSLLGDLAHIASEGLPGFLSGLQDNRIKYYCEDHRPESPPDPEFDEMDG